MSPLEPDLLVFKLSFLSKNQPGNLCSLASVLSVSPKTSSLPHSPPPRWFPCSLSLPVPPPKRVHIPLHACHPRRGHFLPNGNILFQVSLLSSQKKIPPKETTMGSKRKAPLPGQNEGSTKIHCFIFLKIENSLLFTDC